MEDYDFPRMPEANPASVVAGPNYRFTMLNDMALRYEWASDGVFEDRASTFAINRHFPRPEFKVEDQEDQLNITTPALRLRYDKQRFSSNGLSVAFTNKQTLWGVEWRYGNSLEGNMGGTARTLDGVDGRCDMGSGIISTAGYAVLDDSESMLFDDQGFVTTRRPGDRIDGYLFAYGHDYKGAMKSFYAISGSPPAVPRWCLGNWWSRYYAYTSEEYLELMQKFGAQEIPLSVAVIDMDWHLVKGADVPHSGWTGYTWNKKLFPNPEAFTKSLHDLNLKVTLNDHPHAGVHHHEESYGEMATALEHDTTHRAPIEFDPTSSAFMKAYFNVLHRRLEKQGCDFWWIDWQQGNTSRIPGFDPLWLLNHFSWIDSAKQKGRLGSLIFSRYAGPGSHRYPVGFSGDTTATWASLKFQPEFTATSSNIGYGWWSHDIGGHFGGIRDDECLVRWVQFGVFSPIMRLHSANSRWMSKEPWLYRKESEQILRDFLQLRHRLVPYIYSVTMAQANTNERSSYLPLVQPLYWHFPTHNSAYRFPNEYYFGSSLIVAPIVEPRDKRTNLAKGKIWLPPGRHVDIFTGQVYDGDQEIDLYRPLQQIPVFAAEGSIVPLDGAHVPPNGCSNPASYEVYLVVGKDGRFDFCENEHDDKVSTSKRDKLRSTTIRFDQAAGRVRFHGLCKEWTFRFLSTNISKIRTNIDGVESSAMNSYTKIIEGIPNTIVEVPATESSESMVTIELGVEPQLAVIDPLQRLSTLLMDFQISNDAKERIWTILESMQPATTKFARLLSLELEIECFGPLAELLSADSRY